MNASPIRRRALLAGMVAAPLAARAQGFAGLGEDSPDFAAVVPGRALVFPQDHGPHPDYRIEWWYVTAILTDQDGQDCGVQWTLFRNAMAPNDRGEGWDGAQLWMGHAAATDARTHVAAERFGRGGVGQAGVLIAPFDAWLDDWRMHGPAADLTPLRMQARDQGLAYDLALTAEGPLVLHGDAGFSAKSDRGQASYYYSQPFYRAEGLLVLEGRERRVTGRAWLDREWSSQPLDPDQTGWDWFSLTFDDGRRLMLFRVRQTDAPDSIAGTWIEADGAATALTAADATLTPLGHATVEGRRTPVRWRLQVPGRGLDVETTALNAQAWNALTVSYWEGPIRFGGSHAGRGYLEMTGY